MLKIKKETDKNFADIYELIKSAFGQKAEAALVNLLRKSDAFISELALTAEIDNNIVGYILFTKIRIENNAGKKFKSLALAPVAVAKNMQKRGIGAG